MREHLRRLRKGIGVRVRLAIMQPYLFPYLGYFQLMHAVDRFVVYDDVPFIRQGWINRNRLLVNGGPSFFTVPIKHASSFRLIGDTLIDDQGQHERWSEKLLKSFTNAYRRAPEFASVFPLIEGVFQQKPARIADLARSSLYAVARFLDLRTSFVDSSSVYGNAHLKGEERVRAICAAEGATRYVNAHGGRGMYASERFAAQGVNLSFVEPRPIEYQQFGGPFVPDLSIIDVLMFNSVETVLGYLAACELT
jgi:WbqC-like protein family